MRPPRVVAGAALIAVLASVAVSASGWSRTPSPEPTYDPGAFQAVQVDGLRGTVTTTPTVDPANGSAGVLVPAAPLFEPPPPLTTAAPPGPIAVPQPDPFVVAISTPRPAPATTSGGTATSGGWHYDPEESWYGPGFYGQRTACGETLTTTLLGVANRTLPCGTLVEFRNPKNGRTITVPVVDRGPYVSGRQWDLTGGTCTAIDHCWTGPLEWRFP